LTMVSQNPRLSVVMPVYNERNTIREIIRRVEEVTIEKEIIIVDDGSTDGTRALLEELEREVAANRTGTNRIRFFFQPKNCGKGAALRRGFREAQGRIVTIQDADLELDPNDYHKLLVPIENGTVDVVYGSRFLGKPPSGPDSWHAWGNKLLTFTSNTFTSLNLTDVWTCYKVFRRELLQEIEIKEDRFGFEPEVTAKIARHGWRLCEVPISYQRRTYAEGKKIGWKDGVKAIWCIIRYRLFD